MDGGDKSGKCQKYCQSEPIHKRSYLVPRLKYQSRKINDDHHPPRSLRFERGGKKITSRLTKMTGYQM